MDINISKSKKKFRKGGRHFSADFYWQVIFFTGLTVVLISIVWGGYLFMEMNKKFDISPEDVVSKSKPISKARLDQALKYFKSREQKMEEVLNAPSPVIDPSN